MYLCTLMGKVCFDFKKASASHSMNNEMVGRMPEKSARETTAVAVPVTLDSHLEILFGWGLPPTEKGRDGDVLRPVADYRWINLTAMPRRRKPTGHFGRRRRTNSEELTGRGRETGNQDTSLHSTGPSQSGKPLSCIFILEGRNGVS